ncbi:MAG: efflux RND transporter permease subunit, partial [Pirellulales bacterium]|nr:efflux RND transporter permease subunit [Pirellulales bacterium]
MNPAEFSIRNKTILWVAIVLVIVAGSVSYERLGRLEDPEFTIKDALVITPYPGASAAEVEQEVTNAIETAVQELGQLKRIRSKSDRGLSTVTVTIKDKYGKHALPQVWDELRRKVASAKLPPGAGPSIVNDDYGDVYGIFLAVTGEGEGYTPAEVKRYVDLLRRELLLVQDVKRVELFGVQDEAIYVEIAREKMAQLGIPPEAIFKTLAEKNLVTDAGKVRVGSRYIAIQPTGDLTSAQEIENVLIGSPTSGRLIRLGDIATVARGYVEPPRTILTYDGKPAIGLGISTVQGGNVVTMGEAVQKRLDELEAECPFGVKLNTIAMQPDTVKEAVNGFVVNLLEAVAIVIVVLLIFMGVRSGLLIGAVLFLTICGTFIVMDAMGIMLERISLGALIIALGMLVDNAIVVTEGMLIKIEQGEDRIKAAREVVSQQALPLLGATVVAVTAFGAIGLSQDNTGEFCRSLFTVLLISLMLSWVTAVTVTPLFCYLFLKPKAQGDADADPYAGRIFRLYKGFLLWCLRWRWLTAAVAAGLLAAAVYGFGFLENSFFPASTRPQFMVDVWLPKGTDIRDTRRKAEEIEEYIRNVALPDGHKPVENVSAFIG